MIRAITFDKQLMKSEDFAHITRYFYQGKMGVTKGCEISQDADGNIVISDGYFSVYGRYLKIEGDEVIEVPDIPSGTLYSILVFEIDLSQENTIDEFNQGRFRIISDASDYPELIQEDLDNGGTIYQMEFCRFENTVAGISNLLDTRTILSLEMYTMQDDFNDLKQDYETHQAENTAQDNVHGLRSDRVVLGKNSTASAERTTAVGYGTSATEFGATAIGNSSSATAHSAVAIGYNTIAEGLRSIALGRNAIALNTGEGVLGVADSAAAGPYNWRVPGNLTVSGTKNFEIPHPKPEKSTTHIIRHGSVESPTAGDTLYRWKAKATKDNEMVTIELPDYFIWLNKDVQIFVTPQGHFGNGYGVLNIEKEQLEIHCQYEGEYNVLVIGTRNDEHPSVQDWDIKGVEREIGESWTGESYVFADDEIITEEEEF